MLILNRYAGQSILIGEEVAMKVINIGDNYGKIYARLGFEAPNHIRIMRGELLEKDPVDSFQEAKGYCPACLSII